MHAYVVEEHALVRDGLAAWLRLAGLDVVGAARDAASALHALDASGVDLVVIGPHVPYADDLCRLVSVRSPAPRCLVVAPAGRADGVFGSLLARGVYVFSDVEFAAFRAAVAAALGGALGDAREPRRDGEVLRLVAAGLSNRAIAAEMQMSLSWVKASVSRLLTRASVRTRTELVAQALRDGDLGTTAGADAPHGGPHGVTEGIAG